LAGVIDCLVAVHAPPSENSLSVGWVTET
jgi:hypothetical protein